MSYEVMVLNPRPRKRKGRKTRARKHRRSRMALPRRGRHGRFVKSRRHNPRKKRRAAKAAAPRRKRRARRMPKGARPAMGYVVGKKRIRRKKLNPRHRRRAHRRHNPRFTVAGITSALVPAAWGAGGAIALDVAYGYASPYLPSMLTTGYAKHATKIAGALGIGWLGRKFFGSRGHAIGAGALTVTVYALLKDVLTQFAPAIPGLGDYEQITIPDTGNIAGYVPGTVSGPTYLPDGSVSHGTGAYMEGMGAYMEGQYVDGVDF